MKLQVVTWIFSHVFFVSFLANKQKIFMNYQKYRNNFTEI